MPAWKAAIATALAGASAASGEVPRHVRQAFDAFEARYGKNYAGQEQKKRLNIFAKNLAFVEAENSLGHTYRLGINKFSDLTPKEFKKRHLGLKRRQRGSVGWNGVPHLGTHEYDDGETLPQSVDWRTKGAVNAIKDQGQCGSCWAFATVGAIEGAWEIASGSLPNLSEQQLVDCSRKNDGCGGGDADLAFAFEERHAVCTEESYTYTGKNGRCHRQCSAGIPAGGVVGYKDVRPDCARSLMSAVAQQPVAVAIEADQTTFQAYESGILSGACGTDLDHAVVAVGYGEEEGTPYWLVRNSWGEDWGEDGYVKMLRGGPGKGECGIQMEASYPVVKVETESPQARPHYGEPPCRDDEAQAAVSHARGSLCAPECKNQQCPSDAPAGTTATPKCMLQDPSTESYYCALSCHADSECPSGATCATDLLPSLCLFPGAATTEVRDKVLSFRSSQSSQNIINI